MIVPNVDLKKVTFEELVKAYMTQLKFPRKKAEAYSRLLLHPKPGQKLI